MQDGDLAVLYQAGQDPSEGTAVTFSRLSKYGTELASFVPLVTPDLQYYLSVRPTLSSPSRFSDLPLYVDKIPTGTGRVTVIPDYGTVGSHFEITDEYNRIQPGDMAIFHLPGMDPSAGKPATDVYISTQGSHIEGRVPDVFPGFIYSITVRPTPASPARFEDLGFLVSI